MPPPEGPSARALWTPTRQGGLELSGRPMEAATHRHAYGDGLLAVLRIAKPPLGPPPLRGGSRRGSARGAGRTLRVLPGCSGRSDGVPQS